MTIMPGIENLAPERQGQKAGWLDHKCLPVFFFQLSWLQLPVPTCPLGNCGRAKKGIAGFGCHRKAGRNGKPRRVISARLAPYRDSAFISSQLVGFTATSAASNSLKDKPIASHRACHSSDIGARGSSGYCVKAFRKLRRHNRCTPLKNCSHTRLIVLQGRFVGHI